MEYWITLWNPIAIRLTLHFGVISGWTILFFSLFNLASWFWLLWSLFYFVKSLAFFRVRFGITLFFLTKVKNTVSIKSFIFAYQKQYKLINFYKGNYITAIIIDIFIIAVFSFILCQIDRVPGCILTLFTQLRTTNIFPGSQMVGYFYAVWFRSFWKRKIFTLENTTGNFTLKTKWIAKLLSGV